MTVTPGGCIGLTCRAATTVLALIAALTAMPAQSHAETPAARRSCGGERATIQGTQGRDHIVGTPGSDVIWAGGGDDIVRAVAGSDVICAGAGADTIWSGTGGDAVFGGPGPDTITDPGEKWLDFEDGLYAGLGDDVIRITGRSCARCDGGAMYAELGPGDDRFVSTAKPGTGATWDSVLGGPGRDYMSTGPQRDSLAGGPGRDRLNGGAAGDWFFMTGDGDVAHGAGSEGFWFTPNTVLYSRAPGPVRIDLRAGVGRRIGATVQFQDRIFRMSTAYGSKYSDVLRGALGRTQFFARDGNDQVRGFSRGDAVSGGPGDDSINTGGGHDSADAGPGADHVFGAAGPDSLGGGSGDDVIDGGIGRDGISGNGGRDVCRNGEILRSCESTPR